MFYHLLEQVIPLACYEMIHWPPMYWKLTGLSGMVSSEVMLRRSSIISCCLGCEPGISAGDMERGPAPEEEESSAGGVP